MDRELSDWYGMSDQAMLKMLGNFIRKTRLKQNTTQQALAEYAGVNRSTVIQIEKGSGGTLLSFIQLLRALEQLQALEVFKDKPEFSPLALAKMEKKMRTRAASARGNSKKPESTW